MRVRLVFMSVPFGWAGAVAPAVRTSGWDQMDWIAPTEPAGQHQRPPQEA